MITISNDSRFGGSTAPQVLPASDAIRPNKLFDENLSNLQKNINSPPVSPNFLPEKLKPTDGETLGKKQSLERVKRFAKNFLEGCWKNYAKLFPEAFSNTANGATKMAPKLVFSPTQSEVDKTLGGARAETSDVVAFVNAKDPSRVHVHSDNLYKYAMKYGADYVKNTMAHELIHSLTNASSMRSFNDLMGETATYSGVKKDLELNFKFDERLSPGINDFFSVQELIREFSAEHYAAKVTGVSSFSVAYSPIRSVGEKLLQLVGEDVFRKAVIANDPLAYRQVIEAAKTLQKLNEKAAILVDRNKAETGLRESQAATPFGKPLDAATLEKVVMRHARETLFHGVLKNNFPEQIKNFDFRLMHAVDADLKSRGVIIQLGISDAEQRQIAASVTAVWPLLK